MEDNYHKEKGRNVVMKLLFADEASRGRVREWWDDLLPRGLSKGDTVWLMDFMSHEIVGGACVEKVQYLGPDDYEDFACRFWRNAGLSREEYLERLLKAPAGNGLIRLCHAFRCRPVPAEGVEDHDEVSPELLTRLRYSRLDAYNDKERTIPRVLDACCGSRMMWYDHDDRRAVFMDVRRESHVLCDGRELVINPDVVADFREMPFPDGVFDLVSFDPPHLLHAGEDSWLRAKYGVLDGGSWQDDLRQGFAECWRVLAAGGTLVFKWCEEQVRLAEVLPLAPARPLFGQRRGKTLFLVFNKGRVA